MYLYTRIESEPVQVCRTCGGELMRVPRSFIMRCLTLLSLGIYNPSRYRCLRCLKFVWR